MTGNVLDDPRLCQHLFFPRRTPVLDPFLVEGDGFRLACRYRRVDPARPTVIHFHGNGETAGDGLVLEAHLAALGVNVLLAEYRGYGMSTGTPAVAAMLADVALVVKASGAAPEQLVFFGRSLGSLYAVHGVALYPQAAGLILESGIAAPLEDLLHDLGQAGVEAPVAALEAAVARDLDQRAKLAGFRGRTLVLHTVHDSLVPVSHARRLHQWANEPKRLVLFEEGDHNDIFWENEEAYLEAVAGLVEAVTG